MRISCLSNGLSERLELTCSVKIMISTINKRMVK